MTAASFSTRTVLVADLVERRHLLGGEAAGLAKDGVDQILAEIAKRACLERRLSCPPRA